MQRVLLRPCVQPDIAGFRAGIWQHQLLEASSSCSCHCDYQRCCRLQAQCSMLLMSMPWELLQRVLCSGARCATLLWHTHEPTTSYTGLTLQAPKAHGLSNTCTTTSTAASVRVQSLPKACSCSKTVACLCTSETQTPSQHTDLLRADAAKEGNGRGSTWCLLHLLFLLSSLSSLQSRGNPGQVKQHIRPLSDFVDENVGTGSWNAGNTQLRIVVTVQLLWANSSTPHTSIRGWHNNGIRERSNCDAIVTPGFAA